LKDKTYLRNLDHYIRCVPLRSPLVTFFDIIVFISQDLFKIPRGSSLKIQHAYGFHSFILSFPFLSFSLFLFFLEFIWVNFNYFLKMLLFLMWILPNCAIYNFFYQWWFAIFSWDNYKKKKTFYSLITF
jgi:hypothetical protein